MLTGPLFRFLFTSLIPPLSLPAPAGSLCMDLAVLSFQHFNGVKVQNLSVESKAPKEQFQIKSIITDELPNNEVRPQFCYRQLSYEDKMGLCCPLLVRKTPTYQKTTK